MCMCSIDYGHCECLQDNYSTRVDIARFCMKCGLVYRSFTFVCLFTKICNHVCGCVYRVSISSFQGVCVCVCSCILYITGYARVYVLIVLRYKSFRSPLLSLTSSSSDCKSLKGFAAE